MLLTVKAEVVVELHWGDRLEKPRFLFVIRAPTLPTHRSIAVIEGRYSERRAAEVAILGACSEEGLLSYAEELMGLGIHIVVCSC